MDDLDALRDALAADLDATFEALVVAVQDDLFAGVLRLVGDRGRAEDLVQEALVRAHRALSGYDADRIATLAVRPWLWTIALNLVRNDARDRGRRPQEVLGADREPVASAGTAEDAALDGELSAPMTTALAALPPRMRTAVVLRHVVGLGPDEIAVATARSSTAVRADVHRGLRRLADELAAIGEQRAATTARTDATERMTT